MSIEIELKKKKKTVTQFEWTFWNAHWGIIPTSGCQQNALKWVVLSEQRFLRKKNFFLNEKKFVRSKKRISTDGGGVY